MKTDATISNAAAVEVIRLIEEYLHQGGTGRDETLLVEALRALEDADHITIEEEAEA